MVCTAMKRQLLVLVHSDTHRGCGDVEGGAGGLAGQ